MYETYMNYIYIYIYLWMWAAISWKKVACWEIFLEQLSKLLGILFYSSYYFMNDVLVENKLFWRAFGQRNISIFMPTAK